MNALNRDGYTPMSDPTRPMRRARFPLRLSWRDRILLPLILLLTVTYQVRAQQDNGPGAATLVAQSMASDAYLVMPYVDSEVTISVNGMVARVTVTQHFFNDTGEWLEGKYLFPLPENAAVDRLKLIIGDRIIEGEIREKEQARREFAEARRSGKRAGLVEQSRPNLFSTEVTNIAPDEHLAVEISYLQTLDFADGGYSLRYPMTITPRYAPGMHEEGVDEDGTSRATKNDAQRARDPFQEEPSALTTYRPSTAQNLNMTSLSVRLNSGVPLDRLESLYHDVETSQDSNAVWWLQSELVPSDRDFVLNWSPATGAQSLASVFTERKGPDTYLLMMVMPPQQVVAPTPPRELIFIVDTSGSMLGASMDQAKQSLLWGLDTLRPEDRFNLVPFNSEAQRLYPESRAADDQFLNEARGFVDNLEAGGGTEMSPALSLALNSPPQPGYLRQVVFITDGSVGNEKALFQQIQEQIGQARLFTVGIGSAPNSYFMRKAAQFGRGTFTYVGRPDEVQEKMSALFAQLEFPVMQDLGVEWPGVTESYPRAIPDLYLGEPVVVTARYRGDIDDLSISNGDKSWARHVSVDNAVDSVGVASLWARRRIESLTDSLVTGEDPQLVKDQVLETALAHHLVSPYTSLIAVDKTPARSAQQNLKHRQIASNLPHGASVILPQGATGLRGYILMLAFGLTLVVLGWRMRTPDPCEEQSPHAGGKKLKKTPAKPPIATPLATKSFVAEGFAAEQFAAEKAPTVSA